MKQVQIGDVVGDYKVIHIAGSGGMGAVYKIEHLITKRIEAMKFLPPGLDDDPEQVRRFEREIQVQARLHHPNIAALYNAVRAGNSVALVMEFVEGQSLQRILESGPLPVETAVNYTTQVLGALAYAHDAGVIHRDVSPANIIVTPELQAKLTDFGLARSATDLQLSTSGVPLGSPWYMSPEQVRGAAALDARTDLYAMGAVLHEMLTGHKLFEAEGAFAVMQAHIENEPPAPSSLNPKVPVALDAVLHKALAKDPAQRFQSADEFRLALQLTMDGVRAPMAVPLGSRPAWVAPAPAPALVSRLLAFRPSRRVTLWVLVPSALVVGFGTIRFLPATAHAQGALYKSQASTVAKRSVVPELPPVVSGTISPFPAQPEPQISAPEQGASGPTASTPSHRSNKSSRNYGIRVTGGEVQAAEVAPPPAPAARHTEEAQDQLLPKRDCALAPWPPQSAASSSLVGASQSTTQAKSPAGGNRLVRALGKVNPFRKHTKSDNAEAAETAQK